MKPVFFVAVALAFGLASIQTCHEVFGQHPASPAELKKLVNDYAFRNQPKLYPKTQFAIEEYAIDGLKALDIQIILARYLGSDGRQFNEALLIYHNGKLTPFARTFGGPGLMSAVVFGGKLYYTYAFGSGRHFCCLAQLSIVGGKLTFAESGLQQSQDLFVKKDGARLRLEKGEFEKFNAWKADRKIGEISAKKSGFAVLNDAGKEIETLAGKTSEEKPQEPKIPLIVRESLNFAGWDPDETVPAHVYYKKGNKAMPVVIFMHGMGGFKEQYPARMEDWADKGMFVVVIDAHLHGGRKIPGVNPGSGALGTNQSVWFHQTSVSHTARDVSKIIDALAARNDVDLSRIGVAGISMGSSTCMVLGWKEPRISVIVGMIGAVDFWSDMTKTPPGPEQDAKRKAFSPRVQQLVSSIDPHPEERKRAFAPKAVFLANGVKDEIDIETIRRFVKDLRPGYAAFPDRLAAIEEPGGHSVTDRMWTEGTKWLQRHLIEKPIQPSK